MSGGTVVNQWGATTAQNPGDPQPALLPLALALDSSTVLEGAGTPTAGNWLFGVAAWRQNSGSVPTISYNSTVNIRDDAHNFWTPLTVVAPETGIVRTSVWMAPAARVPEYVFASPTAYQAGLALTVFEVTADCPWYEVASITSSSTNQGTAVTLSQSPSAGLFSVGVLVYDLTVIAPVYTDAGWSALDAITASNDIDNTADVFLQPFYATTTGSAMTLGVNSGTAGTIMDFAGAAVTVHGVTDGIAFPYNEQFPLQNWPALVFEMACGATLNENWSFDSGISPWAEQNGSTISASPLYTFGNSAGSLLVTPDGVHGNPGAISEVISIPAQQPLSSVYTATYTAVYEPGGAAGEGAGPVAYDATAWVNIPGGWAGGVTLGVAWLDSGDSFISSTTQNFTVTGALQELAFTAGAPVNAAAAQLFVQLGPPSLVGAYFNTAHMGAADFNAANTLWQAWTGTTVPVTRVYLSTSPGINASMTQMIAAGTKMLISIQPPYNPVSATELANITAWVANLKAAGAVCDIAIWSEPYYSGLTAAQYIAAVQYYGPAIRAQYPLVFVTSTGSVQYNNENAFYPGDAWVDKVATDFYIGGDNYPALDAAASPADTAVPPKPFGVWEFNGATDLINGSSQANITAFFSYIQSYFTLRAAAGKQNADLCLFNGGSNYNWLGNGSGQNAGFEGGLGTWTQAGGCSIATSSAQAHSGTSSLALTATGTANMNARSNTLANWAAGMPCAAGNSVFGFKWFRAATAGRNCQAGVVFFDNTGSVLATTLGTAVADTTTGWVQPTVSATAPASTAFALLLDQVNSPAGAGEIHYADDGSLSVIPAVNDLVSVIEFSWDYRLPLWTAVYTALNNPAGATPGAGVLAYVGYAALSIPGVFGNVPDDQITWTDLSERTITQAGIRYSRGIQYEQQSLESGELEIPLWNNDGWLTPGNPQSPYYPYAGQTDVPVRLRAIWPRSLTPYSVLYTGFSDDVKFQRDETTLTSYATLTAADAWSRLTAQMLTAAQQEMIADLSPGGTGGFWPCNDQPGLSAANLAPTALGPLIVQVSKYGNGGGALNIFFGSNDITLAGDPGGTGWLLDSLSAGNGNVGASLLLYPQNNSSLPPPSGGVTVEFWVLIGARVASITWAGVIAACVGVKGRVWELSVGAPTGGSDGQLGFTVWDKITNTPTSTTVNAGDNWDTTSFISITFTQTTWQIYQDGNSLATGTCNFSNVTNGYVFNGLNIPWQGLAGNSFNGVLQDIAVYPLTLPQPRIINQYNVALNAEQDELDTSRIARVVGYGGFTPPLAMPGILGLWPGADIDPVTQITDTLGQVVSSYLTNIASSTLAGLFTDGTGALVYRRRLEWYDRAIGTWALGENAPLALNVNPYFGTSVTSWAATNAALTWAARQGEFYGAGAAQLTASGGGQVIFNPESQPAAPGQQYSCVITVRCPAGYSAGGLAQLVWIDASNTVISRTSGDTVPLVAGAWTWLFVTGQAPAATAKLRGNFDSSGTPSNGTVFYVSSVVTAIYPGEAPYLRDEKLSDDRAQMFNSAVVTQSGTGTKTTFAGTSFNFTPTSGITVTAVNEASASQRGNVPYTATSYLQNTAQNTPEVAAFTGLALSAFPGAFVPAEGCIEDFAQWIINTLGTPVLRAVSATLTPGSTWQDMITALQAEVGDTVTLNLRTLGAPALSLLTYLSAIEADIDIRTGWTVTYQLSPAPQASILLTDDPSNGVLDGSSILGW